MASQSVVSKHSMWYGCLTSVPLLTTGSIGSPKSDENKADLANSLQKLSDSTVVREITIKHWANINPKVTKTLGNNKIPEVEKRVSKWWFSKYCYLLCWCLTPRRMVYSKNMNFETSLSDL